MDGLEGVRAEPLQLRTYLRSDKEYETLIGEALKAKPDQFRLENSKCVECVEVADGIAIMKTSLIYGERINAALHVDAYCSPSALDVQSEPVEGLLQTVDEEQDEEIYIVGGNSLETKKVSIELVKTATKYCPNAKVYYSFPVNGQKPPTQLDVALKADGRFYVRQYNTPSPAAK
eukprot:TRINITY_DN31678_c0_g1_i1.p1 TRINITY_DN31678_c0_g1~~TRINITY_DN31678_c0_g1_i1.p1  ORF type:complete len:175 (-),score=14.69 TRINITY_DN31678_c0_g1_i1:50-574(-)